MIPLNSFGTGVLAEILRRQPPSKARTRFAWQLAVGQALARVTTVDLEDGILNVRAIDRRWLAEIDRASDAILRKMQELVGRDQVTKVRTQC
jgi:predicted nucleic acid-binding Zn ribbon protein